MDEPATVDVDAIETELVQAAERHTTELVGILDKLGEEMNPLTFSRLMGSYQNRVAGTIAQLLTK